MRFLFRENGTLANALFRASNAGRVHIADILSGPEMLNARQMAARMGVSPAAIHKYRHAGKIIALDGPAQGMRFPDWQLAPDGTLLDGIPQLLEFCKRDAWTVYLHLLEPCPGETEVALYQKLRQGYRDEVLAWVATAVRKRRSQAGPQS